MRFLSGGRSSKVEPQIVILVVAGSSPVGHPIFFSKFHSNSSSENLSTPTLKYTKMPSGYGLGTVFGKVSSWFMMIKLKFIIV